MTTAISSFAVTPIEPARLAVTTSTTAPAAPVARGGATIGADSFDQAPQRRSGLQLSVPTPPSLGRENVGSHSEASQVHASVEEAQAAQARQGAALLDVNRWSELVGGDNAFALHDAAGKPVDRPAQVGDYVKITPNVPGTDRPAPGAQPVWVRIESAEVTPDRTAIVVRPSNDPTGANPAPTAHFFDSRATNTFAVERDGTTVKASVTGRNEYANDGAESGGGLNGLVNRATAELLWGAGANDGYLPIPGTDRVVPASIQRNLWNTFTSHMVRR